MKLWVQVKTALVGGGVTSTMTKVLNIPSILKQRI